MFVPEMVIPMTPYVKKLQLSLGETPPVRQKYLCGYLAYPATAG